MLNKGLQDMDTTSTSARMTRSKGYARSMMKEAARYTACGVVKEAARQKKPNTRIQHRTPVFAVLLVALFCHNP